MKDEVGAFDMPARAAVGMSRRWWFRLRLLGGRWPGVTAKFASWIDGRRGARQRQRETGHGLRRFVRLAEFHDELIELRDVFTGRRRLVLAGGLRLRPGRMIAAERLLDQFVDPAGKLLQ